MTIKITQTCDKCGKDRDIPIRQLYVSSLDTAIQQGGWRQFSGKDICADCISEFIGEVNATIPT